MAVHMDRSYAKVRKVHCFIMDTVSMANVMAPENRFAKWTMPLYLANGERQIPWQRGVVLEKGNWRVHF